jgi:hypothetical protein
MQSHLHTSQELGYTKRMDILGNFCTKMKTSGHTQKFIGEVLIAWITNYEQKLAWNSNPKEEPADRSLYKTGKTKFPKRNNWFQEKDRRIL